MDGTLPSYEAAMRDAREYLRRRDLNSQDEIPLYFAWERLYAAANANLSTDFLNETRAELRARQQARLAPRQGLPPPLFTSFDKLNRKSIQSSAFLRSGLSSDAAIEMMARRYRREAEKLRSSRDKLVTSSLSDTGKRVKKSKRNKRTPQEEVDELLEDLERPISTENSRFVASKLMKDRVETSSDGGGKRTKKINEQQRNPGREVEELLAKFEKANILPESKMSASTRAKSKDGLDFAGGKDAFADELAAGANAAKTTELRRSSFSMGNPATDPVLADVENLAAFAAQVSDWRMHPSADAATLPPKPVQSGVTSTTKGSKRVGGANRTRKSAVVEGEADTTFDTSSGSSGPDEDNSNTYGSIRSSAVSTSPTSRRSTAHTSEWEDGDEDNMSVNNSATGESLRVRPAADASHSNPFHDQPAKPAIVAGSSGVGQKPVQLSHAVGDVQVKISGKEIEVTFKGSLNDDNRDEIDNATHSDGNSRSTASNAAIQPSATQKVFGTTDTIDRGSSDKEDEQGAAEQPKQIGKASSRDANVPRKQSSVRFSGVEVDAVNESVGENRAPSENEAIRGDPKLRDVRDSSVLTAPTQSENYQYRNTSITTPDSLYNDTSSRAAAIHVRAASRRQSSTTKRSSTSSRTRIELSNDENNVSAEEPGRGRGEVRVELSSGEESADSTRDPQVRDKKRTHSSRRSRNHEVISGEGKFESDEDISADPDAPDIEYRHHEKRYERTQQQRRISRDTRKHTERGKHHSLRPASSRHPSSRHKQRNHSPDSSNDLSDGNNDYDNRSGAQHSDRRHRSDTAQRARSKTSPRYRRQSSRYPAYELRDRDHHLAAALESPPKRRKSNVRSREGDISQARSESRSSMPTSRSLKLPEGIVWPPGMDAECITRLGLDGHHPIAPPGLEHLVTDEQWGDYWTWLHWYSSWQMWYMKNDKKPRRRSDKEKRSGRPHTSSDEAPGNDSDRYEKRNANWWLDVGPSKQHRRR